MVEARLLKTLDAMRYANVKKNKFAPKKGDLLLDVSDTGIRAVQVVEISYVEFDGRLITVQPGKVYNFNQVGRGIVQDWISRLGLSVVCFGEKLTPAEIKVADKIKKEEEAAAVPFRVDFTPKERKPVAIVRKSKKAKKG